MLFDAHTRSFGALGGVPRRGMPDYVARHIIIVLFHSPLCAQRGHLAVFEGYVATQIHITRRARLT